MFTVILQDRTGKELARHRREGNEKFLLRNDRRFPILSQLDVASYDVFSQEQASLLHVELLEIYKGLVEGADRDHVADLLEMVFRASNLDGATITFTPFSKPLAG